MMLMPLRSTTLNPDRSFRAARTLSTLLALVLFTTVTAGPLRAQQASDPKMAEAMKLVLEAQKLIALGTADSYRQAITKLEVVLKTCEELKDTFRVGSILGLMSELYRMLGENEKALAYLERAIPVVHSTGDRGSEALLMTVSGNIYMQMGQKQKALKFYRDALPLFRAVGDQGAEAKTLNNLGMLLSEFGNMNEALDVYQQTLTLAKKVGDPETEAGALVNIGLAYFELSDYQKALDAYAQSLPLSEKLTDKHAYIRLLNAIGLAQKYIGETTKALDNFNKALTVARTIQEPVSEATALGNIGTLLNESGDNAGAIAHYERAQRIWNQAKDQKGEARTLVNLGNAYEAMKEFSKARALYEQALPLMRSIGDKNGEAGTLNSIGVLEANGGDKRKAEQLLQESLVLIKATGDVRMEAILLKDLASLRRDLGDLPAAKEKMEASLALVESLRGRYTNRSFQTSLFSTNQGFYNLYIEILMQLHKEHPSAGYDGLALQANESARARALLDLLTEARADIRQGVDPQLLESERKLRQQLNVKSEARLRLSSGPFTPEQAQALASEVDSLTNELQAVESNIRKSSPRYAALTQPKPVALKDIQALLDNDTLLLEYSLGEKGSYLWLVSPTEIKSFELPVRQTIESDARKLYELLTTVTDSVNQELSETASRLSRILIAPVAAQLGKKRLVIVADGALQYVPFAVLPDPGSNNPNQAPLVLQHEFINLPSVSVLATLRGELSPRRSATKDLAVLADPVFSPDDKRVKKASSETARNGARWESLPKTREEAEEIVAFLPADRFKKAVDFEANREIVLSGALSQYRYVHFATHGSVDSLHPELSAIVLSLVDENGNVKDGYLRAHDIYNLNLPAELVVLSACQTALGKEIKGEGLINLTRAFMYAGTPRVMASLWAVRDESTAKLMVDFYRGMLKEGKRPAEALRAAQLEMLKSKQWQASHYWAAFTLQGDWR
jgi:CHAT domain-containing protein/Tfp pilus assembly protein PilF